MHFKARSKAHARIVSLRATAFGVICVLGAMAVGASRDAVAQQAPKRGGTAVIAIGSTGSTLNTQLTSSIGPLTLADLWASGLFRYDRNGDKVPQIAHSWNVSEDGKRYTFNLRPNLKWSDGHPFSSDDVAFTLQAFGGFNTYLAKILPNIDRTETPDSNTFVIHLKQEMSAMLEGFDKEVFPLMPKHIYDKTDIPTNPANRAPIGLGPYRFVKLEEGRGIVFERNPHYWDQPRPYLDSVVAVFIPDSQQQMNALYRGEVDVIRPSLPQVGRAIEQSKLTKKFEVYEVKVAAPERLSLEWNFRRPITGNPAVRKALFMAIDRERLAKDVYFGLATPAGNAIPEQFVKLTDPSIDYNKMYKYDPIAAGKLLDEAGFPLKDGTRFPIELTAGISGDAFYSSPGAQIIASFWRAIGIDVKLALSETEIWSARVFKERNFDVSMNSYTGRTDPLLGVDRGFLCNETTLRSVNPTGYCNRELDEVAVKAAAVPTDQRRVHYKRYAEIVAQDLPQINLTNAKKFFALSNRLANVEAEMNVSFNGNLSLSEVWIK